MIENYPNAAQNRDVLGEAGDPVAKWFRAGVDCQTAGRLGAMRCQRNAAATQQGGEFQAGAHVTQRSRC